MTSSSLGCRYIGCLDRLSWVGYSKDCKYCCWLDLSRGSLFRQQKNQACRHNVCYSSWHNLRKSSRLIEDYSRSLQLKNILMDNHTFLGWTPDLLDTIYNWDHSRKNCCCRYTDDREKTRIFPKYMRWWHKLFHCIIVGKSKLLHYLQVDNWFHSKYNEEDRVKERVSIDYRLNRSLLSIVVDFSRRFHSRWSLRDNLCWK